MSGQPEALRLAEALEIHGLLKHTPPNGYRELTQRLNACEQQRDALLTELHKARAALQEHLDELIKSHTHPDTGLITDDADLLAIESDQDLINGIDRVIAQAEGHALTEQK